ncbi:MAG: 4-hydroxy-tetrahydrodipicolinate reductase [Flavobacteriaceae bacterium]
MKIALLGFGRMGKTIASMAASRNHKIVFIQDKEHSEGTLSEAEVAINFSIPEAAVSNIQMAMDHQIPVVCGTTGWLNHYDSIVNYCNQKETAFLYASNFSIGVNLFLKLNQIIAQLMLPYKKEYTVSLEEIHHIHKLDAPSGTALSLAEEILKTGYFNDWELGGTGANKLNIQSLREGEIPGTHTIHYQSDIDQISIKHEAFNRDGFALGSLIAAEWIRNKKGVFTMQDVLNIS